MKSETWLKYHIQALTSSLGTTYPCSRIQLNNSLRRYYDNKWKVDNLINVCKFNIKPKIEDSKYVEIIVLQYVQYFIFDTID